MSAGEFKHDGMNASVKNFGAQVSATKFSKPIADEAQIVVKSAAAMAAGFSGAVIGIKNFLSSLAGSIWNGIKTGIAGVGSALLTISAGALGSLGLLRTQADCKRQCRWRGRLGELVGLVLP